MNLFQNLFERQKRQFATGETRSYAWRIEQLSCMARLIREGMISYEAAMGVTMYPRELARAVDPAYSKISG